MNYSLCVEKKKFQTHSLKNLKKLVLRIYSIGLGRTARNFSILLGQNHIETQDSKKQEIFLESLITHENFEPLRFENDLAILKLERPVEYSDSISPVCLPYNLSTKNIDAKTAYITGWGQTTPGGEFSKICRSFTYPPGIKKTVKTNMKIQRPLSKQCFVLVILKEELMLVWVFQEVHWYFWKKTSSVLLAYCPSGVGVVDPSLLCIQESQSTSTGLNPIYIE
ncbi:serine protease grass-like isoform X2 [Tachypleus tridentatus]|uniref:serine protease grass-like isoform X2 n=1 Tax=Tachypleus tridentatus TaxID=6853 RepID=UPI003FCF37FE